jgi:hypothetical protein
LPQEWQARREILQKGRRSVHQQRERLTDAYVHGVLPLTEYDRRRRDLDQKDHALAEQEQQLTQQAERRQEVAGIASNLDDFCQRVQAGLATATFEQRRRLVELLVDRVVVTDEQVEIRYVFPTSPTSEHVRFCHLRTDYFADPEGIRNGGHKGPLDQIGSWACCRIASGGSDAPPATMAPDDPHQTHEPGDAFAPAPCALRRQFGLDARSSIGSPARLVNLHVLRTQLGIGVRASRRLAAPPCPVPTASTRWGRLPLLGIWS